MKKVNLSRILTNGKAMYLAYDQGLEHGPNEEFNGKNVSPLYIIKIAKEGNFNAVIFHKGIVEKYFSEIKKSKIPLIYKLNGKTKLSSGEPISAQIATVQEARKAGASAVGFTVYVGSLHEAKMIEQFEKIQREAHSYGIPVIAWVYPRGKKIKNDVSREMISYSARVGLEIGADMVKLKYGGNPQDLAWAVKSAGRAKVVVAGGVKVGEKEFLKDAKEIMKTGAAGIAVGRNVWKSENPVKVAKELRRIVFK